MAGNSCLGRIAGSASEASGATYRMPSLANTSPSLVKPPRMFSGAAITRGQDREFTTWPCRNDGSV